MADPAPERTGGDLLSDLKELMRSADGAMRLRAAFSGVLEISLDSFRSGLAKPDLGLPALPGDATTKELFDMLDILGSGTLMSDELFEAFAPAETLSVNAPADTPAAVVNPASEPATPAASDGDTTAAATPAAVAPPAEDSFPPPAAVQLEAPEAQLAEVSSAPAFIGTDGPAAPASESEPPSAPATAQQDLPAPATAHQEPSAPASSVPEQPAASEAPAPPSAAALGGVASALDGAGGAAAGCAELVKQDGSVDVSVTERSMAALQEVLRNKSDRSLLLLLYSRYRSWRVLEP